MLFEAYGFVVLFRSYDYVVSSWAVYNLVLKHQPHVFNTLAIFFHKTHLFLTRSGHWFKAFVCTCYWPGFNCSGFWPTLSVFLQKIPIIGWIFQQPFVTSVSSWEHSILPLFPLRLGLYLVCCIAWLRLISLICSSLIATEENECRCSKLSCYFLVM
jgi:hypothetical protein